MARSSLEDTLEDLKRLHEQGSSRAAAGKLRKALGSRISLVVAKAAEIGGEFEEESVVDALEEAFNRFMVNPVKNDKGCKAKTAAVEALYAIGVPSADIFLCGIRHVQMEPAFGSPVDTAAQLRGLCGLALVRMSHPEAMNELAHLLADCESDSRIMAARAIAYSGDSRGEPLLRFKVHIGEDDPQVMAECFLALLRLDADEAMQFVTAYLDSDDPGLAEAAAVALGESGLATALPPLRAAYARTTDAAACQSLLFAIATLRCDESIEFLLGELADTDAGTIESVLAALAAFRYDPAIRERVFKIVDRKQNPRLSQTCRTILGSSADAGSS